MITSAYLQESSNRGKLSYEGDLLIKGLSQLDIPYQLFTIKRIHRRQLPLTEETLVAGGIDAVHGALKQLGKEIPYSNSYPNSLKPYLHRQVWPSTLAEVRHRFESESFVDFFVKPRGREKCFTGFVCDDYYDFLHHAGHVSGREPVYCADAVNWLTEYRCYIVNGEILSIDHYYGDKQVSLHRPTVEQAVKDLERAGEATASYTLDFGVLATGETSLVERNDGYSVGAYRDISAESYTQFILARWEELVR